MTFAKSLIIGTASLAIMAAYAPIQAEAANGGKPIVIAQAEAPTVAAAQENLRKARAALKRAMASGKGIQKAKNDVAAATKALRQAQAAAKASPDEAPTPDAKPAPAADAAPPPADAAPPPAQAEDTAPTPPPAEAADGAAPPNPAPRKPKAPPAADASPPPAQAEDTAPTPPPAKAADGANPPKPAPRKPKSPPEGPAKTQPQDDTAAAPPKTPLPATADAIKEGETVKAPGGRVIVKEKGRIRVKHDDADRFKEKGGKVVVERATGGRTVTTVNRPDGTKIITIRNDNGEIIKRSRISRDGREFVLIDDSRARRRNGPPEDFGRTLPRLRIPIPMTDYVVESRGASRQRLEETLVAPPVEPVERAYSLEEIRDSARLRDKVRRVDIDTVTFDFGQATVDQDQIDKLQVIGQALAAVIQRNPDEVYLIEGHTDAVGSEVANLALSDERAESVAEILTQYYGIPPENLITQGYGEAYLKVPTEAPERQNRRVTVRRITPLLTSSGNG